MCDLIPYVPGKPVEELEREIGITDAVKIASNENPLGPSPLAIDAVRKTADQINFYPDGDSFYLKHKVAEHLSLDTGQLIFGNGSNDVINVATRTFIEPGDEAVMGEFAFIVYPIVTKAIGGRAVISPMPDYTHDLSDMYSRLTPKTKAVFIANPNNPTGTMVAKDELEWFLDRVPDDILVVIDEAYFEYVDDDEYPNSLTYHSTGKSILTVRTFSKIYGLAGLRVGYGIANPEIISEMHRVREPFNVNSLAQVGARAALDDIEHVENTRRNNKEGLEYLAGELDRLKISYAESYANFILIDLEEDPKSVYESLLREGVIVRPVGGYGLRTHLRVSVGLPQENERFIKALEKVLGA